MPRRLRAIVPGTPLHITQRGVDRGPTFLAEEDFALYRLALQDASLAARCAVHAYVFMSNHVHLLLSPSDAHGPSRMMQSIGRIYVRYFNDKYCRTGTLWEGRFRSAGVASAHHLMACYRYIELNPVRAGMVGDPSAYDWSSHRANGHGEEDPIIVPHPLYEALERDRAGRHEAYRMSFATPLSSDVVAALRAAPRGRPRLHPTTYRQAVAALDGLGAGEPGASLPSIRAH
jgi:putative transposase